MYHQGNNNCRLFLICALTKSRRNGNRLQQDLDELMVFVMAIGSEVFGSSVEEIGVSVDVKIRDV